MEDIMRYKLIPVFIFFILLFLNININACTVPADTLVQPDTSVIKKDTSVTKENDINENIARDFANRLKSQLNLTEEQTDQAESILAGYIEGHTSEENTNGNAGEQISKVLNDSQRASWETIQSAFWDDLNRRIKDDTE
jgi:6-pyruvoyl-tetrahydropterin synthase